MQTYRQINNAPYNRQKNNEDIRSDEESLPMNKWINCVANMTKKTNEQLKKMI
jgi:hypothetical protein